jgi:hypothetical protein
MERWQLSLGGELGVEQLRVVRKMPVEGEQEYRNGAQDETITTPKMFADRLANMYGQVKVGEPDDDGMVEIIVVDRKKATV